jgi:hypothetical protein
VNGILALIGDSGGTAIRDPETDLLLVNGEFSASVLIARCFSTAAGYRRWKLRLDTVLRPDITVAVRMEADNEAIRDYYLLPMLDMREAVLRLCDYNGLSLDAYRFDTLDRFRSMVARTAFRRAA